MHKKNMCKPLALDIFSVNWFTHAHNLLHFLHVRNTVHFVTYRRYTNGLYCPVLNWRWYNSKHTHNACCSYFHGVRIHMCKLFLVLAELSMHIWTGLKGSAQKDHFLQISICSLTEQFTLECKSPSGKQSRALVQKKGQRWEEHGLVVIIYGSWGYAVLSILCFCTVWRGRVERKKKNRVKAWLQSHRNTNHSRMLNWKQALVLDCSSLVSIRMKSASLLKENKTLMILSQGIQMSIRQFHRRQQIWQHG